MSYRNIFVWVLALSIAVPVLADRRETINGEAAAMRDGLVRLRREFHMHPELSNREEWTSARIAEHLRSLGIPVETGIAGYGLVAKIEGARPGPVVAVRADIDALPIQEVNDVPYRSKIDGVKHACGHDLHITVGLGTAELLWKHRDEIAGTVFVVFQPAEEGPPAGEEGGAPLMIKEGLLERMNPGAFFALHSMPGHRAGVVAYREEAIFASSDRFRITITGKQSHGAQPHLGIDPIVTGAQIVQALQTIASRRIDALQPVVVTVGMFHAGTRFNVVPNEAVLEGTYRTLDAGVRQKTRELIIRLSTEIADAAEAKADVWFQDSAANPPTMNDPELTEFAASSLARTLGESNVRVDPPRMVAEDFAHFAERVPSFYYLLGVGDETQGITAGLHTPDFEIDEEALVVGTKAMTNLVMDWLEANR